MRTSVDEWAMSVAVVTSRRTTCRRRAVGCVLLNDRNHVLSTGYNGVAASMRHCSDAETYGGVVHHPHACPGSLAKSGTMLDACYAIHAEQNALLQCRDVYSITTAYVTTSPCMTCCKLLLNTSCQRIVFIDEYDQNAKDLWVKSGRAWDQLSVALT